VSAPTPRQTVAYLMWQIGEGYIDPRDRAVVDDNWFTHDPSKMHPDDAARLPHLLTIADEVLAAIADADLQPVMKAEVSHLRSSLAVAERDLERYEVAFDAITDTARTALAGKDDR
jgi:hypothetical protein